MLRIELTGLQLEIARWTVARVRANLLEQCEEGVSNLVDQLPVIDGQVLQLSDERRGELSVADEFCHVLDFELERTLDVSDDEREAVARAGGMLYQAICAMVGKRGVV
jgi:hypothetical protein